MREVVTSFAVKIPKSAISGDHDSAISGDHDIPAAKGVTFRLINAKKDGTKFLNLVHMAPLYDKQGNLVRIVGCQYGLGLIFGESMTSVFQGVVLPDDDMAVGNAPDPAVAKICGIVPSWFGGDAKAFAEGIYRLSEDAVQAQQYMADSNRQIKLEAERWQQKCAVLKEEFYVLKTESATRVTELEARLSTQAKQLEHYELIEAELDNAILSGRSSEATEMGNTMMTSAKRRVHQALGLAQQVTALRTEKNELVTQLAAIQTANQKLKEASNNHSQPFSLLVS